MIATSSPAPTLPATLEWRDHTLHLLDQTRLPLHSVTELQESAQQVWASIRALKVRGAPAIGVAGAYGLCVAMQGSRVGTGAAFRARLLEQAAYLNSARPTAVNLSWALQRLVDHVARSAASDAGSLYRDLVQEAERIHAEDVALCDGIGTHGAPLIQPGCGVLTHCNAGALATTGIGTATAPMYKAHAAGTPFRVFADETCRCCKAPGSRPSSCSAPAST